MDSQMKKGVLDACVLSVLQNGESYGYRIIKDIERCMKISESTLYPVLRRLESAGDLTTRTAEHDGRLRRYYAITRTGEKHLEEFLNGISELEAVFEFIRTGKGDRA